MRAHHCDAMVVVIGPLHFGHASIAADDQTRSPKNELQRERLERKRNGNAEH